MNVLFVMTDQHQARCAGYEGHPQVITPNLDRLASSGVRFRHAYTANPICTPTRVSILTGQYCHNHGYFGLSGPTPPSLPTFLGHFRRHGYTTAAIGKLHLPNKPRPWAEDDCDLYIDPNNGAGRAGYGQLLKEHGFEGMFDSQSIPEAKGNFAGDARPSKLPFELTVEGYSTRLAKTFIDQAVDRGKPFCMEVSFQRPHQVYTPPREFWDMYPDDLDLPPGAMEDLNPDRPAFFQRGTQWNRNMEGVFDPPDTLSRMRRVWKGYLACITHCDHAVGLLLDHLEARGIADDTIVVYSSDHGAYSGTYGISEKSPGICSEQVCRIPMLWRVPGVTGGNVESRHLAHIVDLAPTLASLCGLPAMDWVDGGDLAPLLRGEDAPVRDVAVTEHVWSKSVRWDRWRLVHYQQSMLDEEHDFAELYDIEADPDETRNLYRDPDHQHVLHEGRRLLLDWLIRTTRYVTAHPQAERYTDGPVLSLDGKESNTLGPMARVHGGQVNYL